MKKVILCIAFVSLSLTGCYDRVEMDDRNYVITIGIDKFDPKVQYMQENTRYPNRYSVSLALAQLQSDNESADSGESKQKEKNIVDIVSGTTLSETLRVSDKYNSKESYYGQLKTVIIGEEVLKDKELLYETMESLEKNNEINSSVIILGCKDKAHSVMEKILQENSSSGLYIWDFYKSSGKDEETEILNIQQVQRAFSEGEAIVIPMIYEKDSSIIIDGGIILRDYEMTGLIESESKQGTHWIMNRGKNKIIQAICDDRYVSAKILSNKTKYYYTEKDNELYCNIDINLKLQIIGDKYFEDAYIIDKFSEVIGEQANEAVKLAIDTNSDFLNINRNLKWRNSALFNKYNGVVNKIDTFVNLEIEYRQ